ARDEPGARKTACAILDVSRWPDDLWRNDAHPGIAEFFEKLRKRVFDDADVRGENATLFGLVLRECRVVIGSESLGRTIPDNFQTERKCSAVDRNFFRNVEGEE